MKPSEGMRVTVGDRVYEWDGADWWCPSSNHDPAAVDDLLDALAAADAREKKLREALEEVQVMDCCGETREYVDEILEGVDG